MTNKQSSEKKHHVQIIDNMYLRQKKDGKYFPTLAQEVIEQDRGRNSSWYQLSDEAYREWLLCSEMWEAEANEDTARVREIQLQQRDLHEKLVWALPGDTIKH